MQAIEIRLAGRYWDSLIYNGRLYLFTREGSIRALDWDRLIRLIQWPADEAPIGWQFLARGRSWYSPAVQSLLRSPSTRSHLEALTERVAARRYAIGKAGLSRALLWEVDSPTSPHSDVETYSNRMYIGSSEGVHETPLASGGRGEFDRILDAPALRLSASYGALAIAAGSDGLIEQRLGSDRWYMPDHRIISPQNCHSCSWVSFDVVASSPDAMGYLAAYSGPHPRRGEGEDRDVLGIIPASDLFERTGSYMFGSADRLIMLGDGFVEADRWNPYRRREGHGVDVSETLLARELIKDRKVRTDVIDAAASVFGYVVEFDDSLVVFASDGTSKRLGEPVNWRCFPRSERYLNQLHVVMDDHVRVFAFTHDYFLDRSQRGLATPRPRVRLDA